jgi:hypothetical protein
VKRPLTTEERRLLRHKQSVFTGTKTCYGHEKKKHKAAPITLPVVGYKRERKDRHEEPDHDS